MTDLAVLTDNMVMTNQAKQSDEGQSEIDDHAWRIRSDVIHNSDVSVRYHRKRQRFFDLLDKCTKAASVMLGASLLGTWVKDHMPLIASAISSLGLLSLVFAYSDRKQSHKELAEAFSGLIQRVEACPPIDINQTVAAKWQSEYIGLSAKEPPTLKTLAIICEHEATAASGRKNHVPMPAWPKRLVAAFF